MSVYYIGGGWEMRVCVCESESESEARWGLLFPHTYEKPRMVYFAPSRFAWATSSPWADDRVANNADLTDYIS